GSARTSGDCGYRVVRGGSWYRRPEDLPSANPQKSGMDVRDAPRGFRLARTIISLSLFASSTRARMITFSVRILPNPPDDAGGVAGTPRIVSVSAVVWNPIRGFSAEKFPPMVTNGLPTT